MDYPFDCNKSENLRVYSHNTRIKTFLFIIDMILDILEITMNFRITFLHIVLAWSLKEHPIGGYESYIQWEYFSGKIDEFYEKWRKICPTNDLVRQKIRPTR